MPLSSRPNRRIERVVAFAGRQYAVRSAATEVFDALEFVAGAHFAARVDQDVPALEIARDGDGYRFIDPASRSTTSVTLGALEETLARVMVYGLVEANDDHVVLHAAALEHRGLAWLLIAPAGCGKTTLTSWLLGHGFGFMTDECVAIDRKGRASGLARPLNVKASGLDVVRSFPWMQAGLLRARASARVTFVPPSPARPGCSPLAALIFPRYLEGAALRSERLSVGRCAKSLMGNLLNARNLPGRGLPRAASLARRVPGYAMQFGELSDASSWLRGLGTS